MRHMILCQLVVLFLAEQTQRINAEIVVAAPDRASPPRGGKTTPTQSVSAHAQEVHGPTAVCPSGSTARHYGTDRGQSELAVCPVA